MVFALEYGLDQQAVFDPESADLLACCGQPTRPAIDRPGEVLRAALDRPLGFPPLAQAATPGDRITLALGPGVPAAAELVTTLIEYLIEAGVDADGISVLVTQPEHDLLTAEFDQWPAAWRGRIQVVAHDPADRNHQAFLAGTRTGDPVLLHRALTDADVVVPIGCMRRKSAAGYFGVNSALYPTFSHEKALQRFRAPQAASVHVRGKAPWIAEVDEVAWLLGVSFTVQVLPGGGEQVLDVLAGDPSTVENAARSHYASAWRFRVPRRAGLVVAGIAGGPNQQTWANLGSALAAASALAEPGGSIAVCTELDREPGPAMQSLAAAESLELALRGIGKARYADALPAMQLARTLRRYRVYLLSGLEPNLVESLGIVPLDDADEVARLVQEVGEMTLLANAPYAAVSVDEP